MIVVPAYMSVHHVNAQYPQKSDTLTGIPDGCELYCMCWVQSPGSLSFCFWCNMLLDFDNFDTTSSFI